MIPVTRPFLPPIEDYQKLIEEIWEKKWLTNSGPLTNRLEKQLQQYLRTENFCLVSNGTIALQLIINQMNLTGEIITTPFSYVATINSILWEKCKPVFVDIDENSLCINPALIEEKINKNTQAIMGVHVFGIPCDVYGIQKVADKHGLKVIYDAAHAFGVEYDGQPIANFGDASTFSFHATKVFQMIEGGGVVCRDSELFNKVSLSRIFGHIHDEYLFCGINAKISEVHSAMGLCTFKHLPNLIAARKLLSERYDSNFKANIKRPMPSFEWKHNYSYYPVILKDSSQRDRIISALNSENIYPRKYFYPSLNKLPFLTETSACPVSESISDRILCLPHYYELSTEQVDEISDIILKNL